MLEARITKKLMYFTLDIQLKVDNEILVLWGSSGAGKTTVLHCLAGLMKPSYGFIKLDNQALYSSEENIDVPTRFRNVGYLFQDYFLFPHMTVRQNVLYGLENKNINQMSSAMDPLERLSSFGIRHLIDRYPGQLSGGEKQRVALVRALAVRPRLLLLDEPFSALDKSNKVSLRMELKKFHQQWQIPFILVTHDEEDAKYLGDRIIHINNGQSRSICLSEASLFIG